MYLTRKKLITIFFFFKEFQSRSDRIGNVLSRIVAGHNIHCSTLQFQSKVNNVFLFFCLVRSHIKREHLQSNFDYYNNKLTYLFFIYFFDKG